jgi:hypothetical protein
LLLLLSFVHQQQRDDVDDVHASAAKSWMLFGCASAGLLSSA